MQRNMRASPLAKEIYATGKVIDLKNRCIDAQMAIPTIGRKASEYSMRTTMGIANTNSTKKGDINSTPTLI